MFEALVLALSAVASSPTNAERPIIVTGSRLSDAREALRKCVASHCRPDEDIDASLSLAEAQIGAGDYDGARETLINSLKRNKDEARRYPVPVSDLYRAHGRVSAHLGLDNDYYRSTWGIYQTLKRGLPSDKIRQYYALMEVAEMMGETRGHERARLYYDSVASRARKDGLPAIAAMAELRSYILHYPPGETRDKGIRRIAESDDPAIRPAAIEAKSALARMAFERRDYAEGERLAAELKPFARNRPILVYAPPFVLGDHEISGQTGLPTIAGTPKEPGPHAPPAVMGSLSTTKRLPANYDDDWIDVTFQITPAGKVADLTVRSKKKDYGWADPLLASIRGRRYSPGILGDPSSIRRERYTYTAGWEAATGTHLLQRSPEARVEFFDLTSDTSIGNP